MPEKTAAQIIAALRRRLERWELDHLRALSAQQADRIERLETELDIAQQDAEFWHAQTITMMSELQAEGAGIGLTKEGALVIIPNDDGPLIERRGQPIEGAQS